jgi:hypothetical protein
MRAVIFILTQLFIGVAVAQTPINKNYAVATGQSVVLKFDYPELVKITTWDKNEISITGTVNINGGENNDALEFLQSTSGKTLIVENKIKNLKQLPQRITITKGEEKITFKTKADFEKYCQENGRHFNMTTMGVDMDIILEIKVPKNIPTTIEATYGIVEVKNFSGPLTVDATYGGVDVALDEKTTGELAAETSYGQIYSNLELKFLGTEFKDFHTQVLAKPGSGPSYKFESKYGNVYLRKAL